MKKIFIRFNSMIIALMAILLFSGNAFANIGAPTFNPPGGTYASAQVVTIEGSNGNFSIRYTTDGTDPTADYGTIYTDPITISVNTTLKAVQYQNNNHGNISDITTDTYFICGKCATCVAPVFNPGPDHYNSYQQVSITAGNGCTIRYTLDGSIPSHSNGIIYTDPVNITTTSTLKAISYKDGELDSPVISGKYYIELVKVAKPTFSPIAKTYDYPQTVTIATTTPDATIMYTLDGTNPS
ncbi:MAG TPA: chitobiase/beta-hexosaminidase C-terminal domain-containing protein, partial [Bacteroidales bacterium]|nr:chitobiase/beta-hexosaminidase C-terminal domain-containing protein [Bacteroidales bacterium]